MLINRLLKRFVDFKEKILSSLLYIIAGNLKLFTIKIDITVINMQVINNILEYDYVRFL